MRLGILNFGLDPRRFAAEIGGRLVRGRRVGHGQYERLLSGRRLQLPAKLAQPEQHGRLLLRPGRARRVDHGRQVRVHQLRVAGRQPEDPCKIVNTVTRAVRGMRCDRKMAGLQIYIRVKNVSEICACPFKVEATLDRVIRDAS